jgi:hypothetical protein
MLNCVVLGEKAAMTVVMVSQQNTKNLEMWHTPSYRAWQGFSVERPWPRRHGGNSKSEEHAASVLQESIAARGLSISPAQPVLRCYGDAQPLQSFNQRL